MKLIFGDFSLLLFFSCKDLKEEDNKKLIINAIIDCKSSNRGDSLYNDYQNKIKKSLLRSIADYDSVTLVSVQDTMGNVFLLNSCEGIITDDTTYIVIKRFIGIELVVLVSQDTIKACFNRYSDISSDYKFGTPNILIMTEERNMGYIDLKFDEHRCNGIFVMDSVDKDYDSWIRTHFYLTSGKFVFDN